MVLMQTQLFGVDFTSAPSRRKAITFARGELDGDQTFGVARLLSLTTASNFDEFDQFILQPGPWIGAFDLPFGLPQELVEVLGWPQDYLSLMKHYCSLERREIVSQFKRFCDSRPVGQKFAHRKTDRPADSSSSMKWVNPPVAFMMHAGVPRLLAAGVTIYGLHQQDPERIALEAYPGLLARSVTQSSYKSDDLKKQTPARTQARAEIVNTLKTGNHRYDVRLQMTDAQCQQMIDDPTGDLLDAALCLVQAAWALRQGRHNHYGLPNPLDPLEGWILGA